VSQYSFDVVDDCQAAYVFEGRTFEEVSAQTGVSVSQLKNWAKEYSWKKMKDFFQQARSQKRIRILKLSVDALQAAGDAASPQEKAQLIHAWKGIEDVLARITAKKETQVVNVDEPTMFLKNLEFIAGTLKTIDPQGLKILARNFDALTKAFKRQYAQAT